MTNFWSGITKQEVNSLIDLHKGARKMNEMQIEVKKQEMADALRSYLIEQEATWFEDRLHAIEECIPVKEDGQPNYPSDIETMTEEISIIAWLDPNLQASLTIAKVQAGDGYRQAGEAFKLLENVYDFLSRMDKVVHKAAWIHRYVNSLKQRIEEFLPGIKEKHS